MDSTKLIENLKAYRKTKGWNQAQMADYLSVGFRTYQEIEKTGKVSKVDVLKVILEKIAATNTQKNVSIETGANEKEISYNTLPGVIVVEGQGDVKKYLKNKGADPNGRELGHVIGNYISKGNKEFIELSKGSYLMITPLVNKKAHAGYLTGWGDEEFIEELPKHSINVDKPYRGEYLSFETVGMSMDDGTDRSICENDIVTGRKIDRSLWKNSKLHLNKYDEFIIVATEGILVKKIIKHDIVKQTITFTSYNPDKETYPDQTINLDQVMQLFNVVQVTKNRKKG